MFTIKSRKFSMRPRRAALWLMLAALVLQAACTPLMGQRNDGSQATIDALQATINAPTATPAPTQTPPPTPVPPTVAAPTQAPPPTEAPQPAQPAQATQAPQNTGNMEEAILNSNVLVYEDTAGYPAVQPYVAAAMERLGFRRGQNYVYLGDAQGRLLDQMLGGMAPNGKPWDLIIVANEMYHDVITGDFFTAMESVLARGEASLILEHFALDELKYGAVKPLLLRCGVDVTGWPVGSPNDLNLFIMDENHPSVSELVKITRFRVADTWSHGSDVGDLMYLTGTGDARIILGTRPMPGDDTQYGALVECDNSRLMLQTTSTHNYMDDSIVSLWANNIHYMLRKKHGG